MNSRSYNQFCALAYALDVVEERCTLLIIRELLSTKLSLPRLRSRRVLRSSLLARLDAGLQQPLTLLSAPAGYGKTTLVAEWVQHPSSFIPHPLKSAWVSLDPGDNDPLRFWRYVLTGVQAYDPEAGASALTLLNTSQQPNSEAVLTALINDLALLPGQAVLVLEDYHVITHPQIHAALAFLLDHLPPTMHLVLLTRIDPPLPLARMRARNQVNELRASDLRFSEAETRDFLQQAVPYPISPQTAGCLAARTEGWPAGLGLVALALQGRQELGEQEQFLDTFTGSHRPILKFLAADVLASQTESIQEFLLETSLLNRLTGALCDAVTGRDDSARLLDQLESANLFLEPLDGAGLWYRFHGLFAEAMRYTARQRLGEPRLRQLALNASRWYDEHTMLSEAVESALLAQDFERAAVLIERLVAPRLAGNEYHTLLRWMQELPDDSLRPHPRLCLTYAQGILFTSKNGETVPVDRLRAPLEMAEQAWLAENNQPRLGELRAFRALVAWRQGDFARAFAQASQALASLSQGGSKESDSGESEAEWRALCLIFVGWEEYYAGKLGAALELLTEARTLYQASGNVYGMLDSAHALAEVHVRRAEPHQAAELYRQAQSEIELAPIDRVERLRRQGRGLAGLADLAYERNDLQAAGQAAPLALALGDELNNEELRVQASWVLARLERARGELDPARSRLDSLAAQAKQPLFLRQVRAWQAWLALSAGDLTPVQRWSSGLDRTAQGLARIHQEQEALILARAQIALGQAEAALPLLERWMEDARAHGRTRSELEIRILAALAQAALDHLPQARQLLVQALNLDQPVSFLRVFLDEGPSLAALLQQVAAGSDEEPAAVHARDLLLVFVRQQSRQQPRTTAELPGSSRIDQPGEPLSLQEERVLRLLAVGHSNPEIAQELVVSVNTIKTHVKSIYRKLNVNNRRAVREAARRLMLLP